MARHEPPSHHDGGVSGAKDPRDGSAHEEDLSEKLNQGGGLVLCARLNRARISTAGANSKGYPVHLAHEDTCHKRLI